MTSLAKAEAKIERPLSSDRAASIFSPPPYSLGGNSARLVPGPADFGRRKNNCEPGSHQINSDDKTEGPNGARRPGPYDQRGQDQIADAAEKHPAPGSSQHLA